MSTNLSAELIGANSISVKWDKAARAEYYHVWVRVVGVGTEFDPVGTPGDIDFLIQSLPSNSIVEIAVSAMNNGGESARTEIISVQTL